MIAVLTLRGGAVSTRGWLKRVLSAVVLVPVFVWLVLRGPGWLFALVVVAVAGVAFGELARLFAAAGRPLYGRLGILCTALVVASFGVQGGAPIALALATLILLGAPVWSGPPPASEPAARTLLGVVYIGWLAGFALWLHALTDGPMLLLFLAGITWVGESAAYLIGSALGRHKLAPTISPGKTVEGGLAQFVATTASALVLGGWLLPDWTVGYHLGAGALLGVVGQIGDLWESVIKRSVGTKDTSGLIPGHGGMLDRIDSLLFNIPLLYVYVHVLGLA